MTASVHMDDRRTFCNEEEVEAPVLYR